MSLFTVLEELSVLNRDNGISFTDTTRLDAIASLLRDSDYLKIEAKGLFHLYSKKPIDQIKGPIVIVSSHVDCEYHITECFTRFEDADTMRGTYDNAITNASITYLMREGNLPENVLIAFTGDEEENSGGVRDISKYIRKNHLDVKHIIVLDVTGEGWNQNADFTVENNFWDDNVGEKIIRLVQETGYEWLFVPSEKGVFPDYVPKERIIDIEAYEDESWEYDEYDLSCCSFCIPTYGEMHCNEGVLARTISFRRYTEVLEKLLVDLLP